MQGPEGTSSRASGPLFRGVFLVALATLIFEISLIRVLSFSIWYHFAYVVISTALLGFGASGTLLALRPGIGGSAPEATLARLCGCAALSGAGLLFAMSAVPFDPMRVLEGRKDLAAMLGYEVGATIPFFFSGLIVSLALRSAAARVDRLYFWDLVGAAAGAGVVVPLMNSLTPPGALLVACAVFASAAVAFGGRRWAAAAVPVALLLLGLAFFATRIPITPAASKSLAVHQAEQKLVPIFTRWTALFRTDVVEKQRAGPPMTNDFEWGLSRTVDYPAQPIWAFVTHDASAGTPIYDLRRGHLDFLDDHLLRQPYLLAPPHPRVLVLGVGGGRDVITAVRYGALHVTGVELDPVTVALIQRRFFHQSDGVFAKPGVLLVAGEGRHFVEQAKERFDLIQITGVDTLSAQTSGAYVLAENYLYTTEAFNAYLDHLTPDGLLSVVTGEWDLDKPQATGRMLLVARQTLLERGIHDPEAHLIAIASGHMLAGVFVKLRPFTEEQSRSITLESDRLSFVPLVLAGKGGRPLYRELLNAKGPRREALLASLPYVLDPVTDDNPFFFRFFRWKDLGHAAYGPFHTSALSQVVLLVLLVSLGILASLLILAPLMVFRRRGLVVGREGAAMLTYFAALGVGFMLLEISLTQRFVLYLGYPTYALTVVLFSLLAFLGCGSYASRRWVGQERTALPAALACLVLLVIFYRLGLPVVEHHTLGSPLPVRVALTVVMLAPLGFVLGLFFPLGIRRVAAIHADLVPWAWAVNGCASVTASVGAVLIAMAWGFGAVWLTALATYCVGVSAMLMVTRGSGPSLLERVRRDLWHRPGDNFSALDGLRGFASVIVVFYHCALFTGLLSPEARAHRQLGWLTPFVNGFWSGIDIFFVLSGFLIARILMLDLIASQTIHYRTFLIRRFCRIFPAYYLILILSLLVVWKADFLLYPYLYGSFDRRELVRTSWMNFVYLNNYLRPGNKGGVFSWGWSLCVEEHFYLVLPPLLWALLRYRKPRTTKTVLFLATFLPFLGRAAQYLKNPELRLIDGFYYYSHNRFDEIFVGVLIAYFYVHHRDALAAAVRRIGNVTWVLGVALIASVWVFAGLFVGGAFAVVWQFLVMALGTALLLLNGLFLDNVGTRFFSHRLWYPLARISYGTYLTHPFVLFGVLEAVGFGTRFHHVGELQLIGLFAAVFLLTSAVAGLLFVFFESPFLKLGVRWSLQYRPARTPANEAA
jgi:peptidoglycan/LPS O-acetylase OafA/YrhL